MILISPSLLSCDFAAMGAETRTVEAAGADWLHVDVMDGHFVPNLTIGPPVVKALKRVATKPLDVHVMISKPLLFAKPFLDAGADPYVFHVEADDDPNAVIDYVKGRGVRVGITLNPPTPLDAIAPYLDRVDLVMVMSVHPGFAGQGFVKGSVERIRALRKELGFKGDVEVDGAVKLENTKELAAAGANILVSGSGIFQSGDVPGTIAEMRRRAEEAWAGRSDGA